MGVGRKAENGVGGVTGVSDTEALSFSIGLFSVELGVFCFTGLCAFWRVVASKEERMGSSSSLPLESESEPLSLDVRDLLFSSAVF